MRMIRRKVKLIPICDRESNNRSLCVIILYQQTCRATYLCVCYLCEFCIRVTGL